MAEEILTPRDLNRATLARQLLLERKRLGPVAIIERLVGMQAQWPPAPYVGIWTRTTSFRREALERELARGTVMDRPWGRTLGALALRGLTGQVNVIADNKVYSIGFHGGAMIASPLSTALMHRLAATSPQGIVPTFVTLGAIYFVVMMFGEVFRIPQWVQDLSPFEHLAMVPAEDFRWAPFLAVAGVAAALSAAGQMAFRRRDVH